MAPSLEAYANDNANQTVLIRINVDQHEELAREFGVRSIPYFVLYDGKGGETSRGPAARNWVNTTIMKAR